ncbi:hypothetical protein [Brevundimonas viscosa]|uniref:PRC-barrel domain-containing protein n=1 Tax=Brevundimonas viscosa TaxID=871741 RepID=A0A1I6Q466_9CAUL|nr:hypothetical protein [Brevundimonas viscosa]SFS47120.1 hypothetical protein SAMN05192570_1538 [Brevundimonas viscosa]
MTRFLTCTAAAAALIAAGPAAAQIAGGLGGQVTGGVSGRIDRPAVGPAAGHLGDTLRGARDRTRDTVSNSRRMARDAAPDVDARADTNARAGLRADRDGAAVDAALQTGVTVRSSDGANLGEIVEVTRNEAGRTVHFLVRSADGTVRMVPAGAVSLDGEAVVTTWSEGQFRQHSDRNNGARRSDADDRR